MFLLPSLALGVVLAAVTGGRLSRLLDVRFRLTGAAFGALLVQAVVFSRLGEAIPESLRSSLHLVSYGLLLAFALANARLPALVPMFAGMALNALAIAVNGGHMPVSRRAAESVGLEPGSAPNLSAEASRLTFLGDVFALPERFPLANVFSVGDVLIGLGAVTFIVLVAHGTERPAIRASRLLAPFELPAYRRLAGAHFLSQMADWLVLALLIGWIYGETGSTGHVAGLLLLRLVPPIVGGGVAGAIADRVSRRRLLVATEIGRVAAGSIALAGVATGTRPAVFVALACSGGLAAMAASATPALLPSLVPGAVLASANAGLGIGQNAGMAAGGAAAGLALVWVGPSAGLGATLAAFGASAVLLAGVRAPHEGRARREAGGPSGLAYLLSHWRLLLLVLSFAAATLATGLTNVSLPRFLQEGLDLSPSSYGFGIAALSCGLVAGQLVVGSASVGATGGRWIASGLALMSGLFLVLAATDHALTAFLLLALIGLVDGTTDVVFDTVVQAETDPAYLGTVFGFAFACSRTTMVAAIAAAPLAHRLLPPAGIVAAAGAILLAAALIALLGQRRAPRAAPAPAPVGSA